MPGFQIGVAVFERKSRWVAPILRGLDARPTHPKTQDENDPLHIARSREVTTLWRLVAAT